MKNKLTADLVKGLTPDVAKQFARLRAQLKSLSKQNTEVTAAIRKLMLSGEEDVEKKVSTGKNGKVVTYTYGPEDSEKVITACKYQKVEADWKAMYKKLYVKQFSLKAYKKLVAKLPTSTVVTIDTDDNPDYDE